MGIKGSSYPDNLLSEFETYLTLSDDMQKGLDYVLSTLTERERLVIKLRFEDKAIYEIGGKSLNITKERFKQILSKAIRKMANPTRFNYIKYGLDGYNQILAEQAKERKIILHKSDEFKKQGIEHLGLSARAYNSLKRAEINSIEQLINLIECNDWHLNIRNLGNKSAQEIIDKLFELSLTNAHKIVNSKSMPKADCIDCRWVELTRPQKCSCCARNAQMKDNFERKEKKWIKSI